MQKAKAFASDPRLKDAMQKAGVTATPDIKFIHVLRMTDAGKCDYVELVATVKDFDAWLKVYDSEGSDARKKDGLVDIVLAHETDDPNMLYLVFKINSIAEANAALTHPVRQKLVRESGIVDQPALFFFSRSIISPDDTSIGIGWKQYPRIDGGLAGG